MKEFIVKTQTLEVKFNFPTELKELTEDYLLDVTSSVKVAPNYSLIGLVYHERLAPLIITCKNKKKSANFNIVPIYVKSGAGETSVVDSAKTGQKVLISNIQVQNAYHVAAPNNKLTLDYFANVINNAIDKELYEKTLRDPDQREVLFVEFKIVPNCDIIALYDEPKKFDSPFVKVTTIDRKLDKK